MVENDGPGTQPPPSTSDADSRPQRCSLRQATAADIFVSELAYTLIFPRGIEGILKKEVEKVRRQKLVAMVAGQVMGSSSISSPLMLALRTEVS